jgi:hypothetical protein
MGIKTLADISAERGSDWQEIVNQKIAEQIYIKQKAQEAGLTMADVQITGAPAAPTEPVAVTPPAAPLPEDTTVQPQLEEAIEPVQASIPSTETFTMRDEPDFNLTAKEMNMVVKAIGIGAKPKTKKRK